MWQCHIIQNEALGSTPLLKVSKFENFKTRKFQNVKISCGLKIAKTEGWNFILIISNNEVDPGLFNVESLFAPGYEYSYDTDENLCHKQILFDMM